jgi:hypothetical protein
MVDDSYSWDTLEFEGRLLGQDREQLQSTLEELGIQHGDLLTAKGTPKKDEKTAKKNKKRERKESLEPSEFIEEVIDPRIVARDLMEDFERTEKMIAFRAYAQTVGVRRIEAVLKGKFKFELVKEGDVLKKLKVDYGGVRDTEIVPYYSKEFLLDTFSHIYSIFSTKSRRKATVSKEVFSVDEIARKNPPVFWSVIYNYLQDKDPDENINSKEKIQQMIDFIAHDASYD